MFRKIINPKNVKLAKSIAEQVKHAAKNTRQRSAVLAQPIQPTIITSVSAPVVPQLFVHGFSSFADKVTAAAAATTTATSTGISRTVDDSCRDLINSIGEQINKMMHAITPERFGAKDDSFVLLGINITTNMLKKIVVKHFTLPLSYLFSCLADKDGKVNAATFELVKKYAVPLFVAAVITLALYMRHVQLEKEYAKLNGEQNTINAESESNQIKQQELEATINRIFAEIQKDSNQYLQASLRIEDLKGAIDLIDLMQKKSADEPSVVRDLLVSVLKDFISTKEETYLKELQSGATAATKRQIAVAKESLAKHERDPALAKEALVNTLQTQVIAHQLDEAVNKARVVEMETNQATMNNRVKPKAESLLARREANLAELQKVYDKHHFHRLFTHLKEDTLLDEEKDKLNKFNNGL